MPLAFFDNDVHAKSTALRFIVFMVLNMAINIILDLIVILRIPKIILRIHSKSDGCNCDILHTTKGLLSARFPPSTLIMNYILRTTKSNRNEIQPTHFIRSTSGAVIGRREICCQNHAFSEFSFSTSAKNCAICSSNGVRRSDLVYMVLGRS